MLQSFCDYTDTEVYTALFKTYTKLKNNKRKSSEYLSTCTSPDQRIIFNLEGNPAPFCRSELHRCT